jgi:hypothetical protein
MAGTAFYGGDWGTDNTIVFVPDYNGGLWSVSANGGTPQPLLRTDVDKDAVSFSDPQILPDGRVFCSHSRPAMPLRQMIWPLRYWRPVAANPKY